MLKLTEKEYTDSSISNQIHRRHSPLNLKIFNFNKATSKQQTPISSIVKCFFFFNFFFLFFVFVCIFVICIVIWLVILVIFIIFIIFIFMLYYCDSFVGA
eukprot:530885_1